MSALVERGAFHDVCERLVTCGVLPVVEGHVAHMVHTARTVIGDAPIGDEWRCQLSVLATQVACRDS